MRFSLFQYLDTGLMICQLEPVPTSDLFNAVYLICGQRTGIRGVPYAFKSQQDSFSHTTVRVAGRKWKAGYFEILAKRQPNNAALDDVQVWS